MSESYAGDALAPRRSRARLQLSMRQQHPMRSARASRHFRRVRSALRGLLVTGLLAMASCAQAPVRWVGEATPLLGVESADYALTVRGTADHSVAVAEAVPIPASGLPALGAHACVRSVRWARAGAHDVGVVWWEVRADSSVVLRLARSRDDGAHWDSVPPADSRDRSVRGCSRPPAAVALDPVSGYTHLAYYLEPSTGAGVFYEHLMDLPRGGAGAGPVDTIEMFHAPVGIVYGQGPVETSVAAQGDTVVVAYQDPNGLVPHISLALSVTAGHAFSERTDVSGVGIAASAPTVAIEGATIAVAWQEAAPTPDGPLTAPARGRRVVRLGTLR